MTKMAYFFPFRDYNKNTNACLVHDIYYNVSKFARRQM